VLGLDIRSIAVISIKAMPTACRYKAIITWAIGLFQETKQMKKQAGFTLIELVAVLVILALLGAMAVPRFTDVTEDAKTAAKNGSVAGVRSGHAMAIAKLKALPQLDQLIDYVGGPGVAIAPLNKGIEVTINGTAYVVETFTDTTCSTPTGNATDKVGCVGNIP
jgi:MSHA pilin protein MshA